MSLPKYEPMLATLWPQAFDDPEWLFELKLDGFRTLLYWDGHAVELRSRSGRDVTALYPELAIFSAESPLVVDGEIVVLDAEGASRFELMQQRTSVPAQGSSVLVEFPVRFVAFDLLYRGEDITALPTEDRVARLAQLAMTDPFEKSEVTPELGTRVWSEVERKGLEGIVAKRLGRPYTSGRRSDSWRKIPRVARMRAVVGGYTPGQGGRASSFGSLLIGLNSPSGLRLVGAVGTGFSDRDLDAIRAAVDEMETSDCPFVSEPELPREAKWVHPQLVAMVGYKEWTSHGKVRAPRFIGFTGDDPDSVTWESEGPGSGH
ncbi:MAG: non-homologous end-joining DNA ligase [Acidimicrobiia bacterium]|nr:non-homologous end-joining DNA ligase [Acidimicrobiia bacterium]MDH3469899.1 non-homologous end-joining DNA ligase [Acidimicrobiia bacterium]